MTSLLAATMDIADDYWAADLGCSRTVGAGLDRTPRRVYISASGWWPWPATRSGAVASPRSRSSPILDIGAKGMPARSSASSPKPRWRKALCRNTAHLKAMRRRCTWRIGWDSCATASVWPCACASRPPDPCRQRPDDGRMCNRPVTRHRPRASHLKSP